MSALTPLQILAVRALRVAVGLAGIFFLLLQSFGPALASPGQSIWVEICSEGGAVWVEVDLEEGEIDPAAPCPKCADCALCAVTGAAPLPGLAHALQAGIVQIVQVQNSKPFVLCDSNWLWPETRGPPATTQDITERAPRASMAFTHIPGGAPWS